MKVRKANDLKSLHASLLVTLALNGINPSILRGPKFWHRGSGRGQTMPMVATVAFLLVVLGVGIFFLIQFFGGSKEVQNAVDGGTLQVAKRALWAPRVQLTHSNPVTGLDEIIEFSGVAKKVKEIELANFPNSVPPDDGNFYIDLQGVNGVWGLALLEALNVQRMQQQGLATATAITHARQIQATAADISKRLAQALVNDLDQTGAEPGVTNPLHKKFHQLANVNTVRMMNWQSGEAIREDDYHNSYTYRGKDSNIQYDTDQATIGLLSLNNINTQPLNGKFLRGYTPCSVPLTGGPALNFMFVPLDHDKKPHLLSETTYGPDKSCSNILSPITTANPPEIPPNAFQFSALAKVEKATKDIELNAFAVSQDMTSGLVLQNTRGFIRVENLPGVPGSNLHVIDEASRETIAGYNNNRLLSGVAGTVLTRSLFNPVEVPYYTGAPTKYDKDARETAAILCAIMCPTACLMFGIGVGDAVCAVLSILIPFPVPHCMFIFCLLCCLSWLVISWGVETPVYCGEGISLSFNPSERPMYGFLPAVSRPGTGQVHNPCGNGTLSRITPANESEHKVFYDWLNDDRDSEVAHFIATYLTHSIIPLKVGHDGPVPRPVLDFPVANMESGMRNRVPPYPTTAPLKSFNVSLYNGGNQAAFTRPGTLHSLLYGRRADVNVFRVYQLLFQRMREMSPQATPADINAILDNNVKQIDMGKRAYIYLDDNNHFQLSVTPGDTLPPWLQIVQNETPDGNDFYSLLPTQFDYPQGHPNVDFCYRLVDPNADWGELNPGPIPENYPTRACSYDTYHFIPSSGFHGLLGVLRLGSKIEKKCLVGNGNIGPSSSDWNQPQDCFCSPERSDRWNNSNCGQNLP